MSLAQENKENFVVPWMRKKPSDSRIAYSRKLSSSDHRLNRVPFQEQFYNSLTPSKLSDNVTESYSPTNEDDKLASNSLQIRASDSESCMTPAKISRGSTSSTPFRFCDIRREENIQTILTPSGYVDDKTSPSLAMLRMTPGVLREKQKRLIKEHDGIRRKGEQLKSGGGVSLWPDMVHMRLSRREMVTVAMQAATLSTLTFIFLFKLHGATLHRLHKLTFDIKQFRRENNISEDNDQDKFQDEITRWHLKFLNLTMSIHDRFEMRAMSAACQFYFLTYTVGLVILFYYLMDNILAHNKLTPSRIKKWTCLLAVISSWTCMMGYLLFTAYHLDREATKCVQDYSSALRFLVLTSLNLDTYTAILLYWRSQFLDNASMGVVSVFGMIPIRQLVYYLQYYSVPIVTVIVSPVVKLCYACLTVYKQGEYFKSSS